MPVPGGMGIEFDSPAAGPFGLFADGVVAIRIEVDIGPAIGESGIGERILRVEFDGAREEMDREIHVAWAVLEVELPAPEVAIVGLDVAGRRLQFRRGIGFRHPDLERLHDFQRDLFLDGEHVARPLVEGLGPDLIPAVAAGQLDRHPQPLARFPYAPLEQGPDAQLAPNLARIHSTPEPE